MSAKKVEPTVPVLDTKQFLLAYLHFVKNAKHKMMIQFNYDSARDVTWIKNSSPARAITRLTDAALITENLEFQSRSNRRYVDGTRYDMRTHIGYIDDNAKEVVILKKGFDLHSTQSGESVFQTQVRALAEKVLNYKIVEKPVLFVNFNTPAVKSDDSDELPF